MSSTLIPSVIRRECIEIERIFEIIVRQIDGARSCGPEWHRELPAAVSVEKPAAEINQRPVPGGDPQTGYFN